MPVAGDMKLPSRIQEAMQMQVEADRRKRATILESEGLFPSPHSHVCRIFLVDVSIFCL